MPDIETKVNDIMEVASEALNEKECEFMGDMEDLLSEGRNPTDAQEAWIDRLYEKVCEGPY